MHTVKIYGSGNFLSEDIRYQFDIATSMSDGKWTCRVGSDKCEIVNELIEEISEESAINAIKTKVNEILLENDTNWLYMPRLRMYYDDEKKIPVLMKI